MSYRIGTYTAAQLAPLVTDNSGGSGRVEVLGIAHGTVILIQ